MDFPSLLGRLSSGLEAAGIPHMVIGGQAVLVHGEPRFTQDIDVTVALEPGDVSLLVGVCDALDLSVTVEDREAFARRTHVLPVADDATGIRVDFVFSSTTYEREAIGRAVRRPVSGIQVPFASVEDLVVHKLLAGRPRDIEDVRGVVDRNADQIDWGYVDKWAKAFSDVPGQEGLLELLASVRVR